MKELKPYLNHLSTCNIKQDWSEAEQAMFDTPERFRDESWRLAYDEMRKKQNTCTCGLNDILKCIASPSQELPAEEKQELENIKETVLKEYKEGNVVVVGADGFEVYPLKEFIEQPTDGLLFDLNRNEAVVLTFINEPKWINDFAVSKVIRELKRQLSEVNQPRKDIPIKVMSEEELDFKQYITNLLYSAYTDGKQNVDPSIFDEFVEAQIAILRDFSSQKKDIPNEPEITITEEEIKNYAEKIFPSLNSNEAEIFEIGAKWAIARQRMKLREELIRFYTWEVNDTDYACNVQEVTPYIDRYLSQGKDRE